jgi:hypothetical protein
MATGLLVTSHNHKTESCNQCTEGSYISTMHRYGSMIHMLYSEFCTGTVPDRPGYGLQYCTTRIPVCSTVFAEVDNGDTFFPSDTSLLLQSQYNTMQQYNYFIVYCLLLYSTIVLRGNRTNVPVLVRCTGVVLNGFRSHECAA